MSIDVLNENGQLPFPSEIIMPELGQTLWCSMGNSFEGRATAAIEHIHRLGGEPAAALLIDYPDTMETIAIEQARLHPKPPRVSDYMIHSKMMRKQVNPHSFKDFCDAISEVTQDKYYRHVIIDITCITKIHAIAAASWLSQRSNLTSRVIIAYTRAENYGSSGGGIRSRGWKDIILAPFSSNAILKNERYGRGIVVLGHEADRLIVALGEIEPTSGVFIVPYTMHRPDLRERCDQLNMRIIKRMLDGAVGTWKKITINVCDVSTLIDVVKEQVDAAISNNAPVVLFPFGPKLQIFVAAYKISRMAPKTAWFVYPVPIVNDIFQTEGIDRTMWLDLKSLS